MLTQPLINATLRRRPLRRRRSRRGAIAVLAVFLTFIFVLAVAMVVNWCWLVLVNRDMQNKCSIMALAAAPALLDDRLLADVQPNANRPAAARAAHAIRQQNNDLGNAALSVAADDVVIRTGYVADVSHRPVTLDESAKWHNAAYVYCRREAGGKHPVRYLASVPGLPEAAEIRGGACAALDNLVVGFRPSNERPAPVMPVAIDEAAWRSERIAGSDGMGGMILRLKAAAAPADSQLPPQPNAALLFYRGENLSAATMRLPEQVAKGLLPGDLPLPDGSLGPVTSSSPLPVVGTQRADGGDASTLALIAAINAATGQKRAFPLFRNSENRDADGVGTFPLVGFVACVLRGADVVDNRLALRVEPCFLIHPSVWTVAGDATNPAATERNLYIYKLRLVR